MLADIKVEKTIADIRLNFGRWKEIMRDPDYEYVHERRVRCGPLGPRPCPHADVNRA